MSIKEYYVYILTNKSNKVLYTGVTNDLTRRVEEHKKGEGCKFTCKYHVHKLVYYEIYSDPENAIKREKQIKGGSRQDKINLVNGLNKDWKDLTEGLLYTIK